MKKGYALPFLHCDEARRCTAPSHFTLQNSCHCVDFYLPIGTPVCAIDDGVVVARESRHNTGGYQKRWYNKANYVIVRHANGRESVYVHLAWRSVLVSVGEYVTRGQVIAQSGMTGYASYPHLHFGLFNADDKNIPAIFSKSLPSKVSWKRYAR